MKRFQLMNFINLAGTVFWVVLLLMPMFVVAQTSPGFNTPPTSPGFNTTPSSGGFSVINPLKVESFAGLVEALLQAAIIIGIPIAVLFIVFAGLKFVLALGSPEKLTIAKKNFFYTIIGIGIFLAASLIAQVIFSTVKSLGSGV